MIALIISSLSTPAHVDATLRLIWEPPLWYSMTHGNKEDGIMSEQSKRLPQGLRLAVVSLPDTPAHSGIAAMNPVDMAELGCLNGGVVAISGRRSSSAVVLPSEDVDTGSIHLGATTRLNVCSRVGDGVTVKVRKKVHTLNRVVFAPVGKVVEMSNLQDLVGPDLNGRFIGKGDHITFPSPNGGILELQAEKVGGVFSMG